VAWKSFLWLTLLMSMQVWSSSWDPVTRICYGDS
jgi:hypothetical protein